jgi:hypothetical protein
MKLKKETGISPEKRTPAMPKSVKQKEPKVSRSHKPDGMELNEWQQQLRKQFGENQNFVLKNTGGHPIFSEYQLRNPQSGKT